MTRKHKADKQKKRKGRRQSEHKPNQPRAQKPAEHSSESESQTAPRRGIRTVRLNQRLILILVAVAALLTVGTHFVHNFQVDRNADLLRDKADESRKNGDLSSAIRYLSQYVRFRPNDTDALAQLGELVKQSSDDLRSWRRVFFTFEEVLRRDPERQEIRRQLVDVAMRLRAYQAALEHIKSLQSHSSDDPELSFLAAECHQATGDHQKAVVWYLKAIQQGGTEVSHYIQLANLVVRRPYELPLRDILTGIVGRVDSEDTDSGADEKPDEQPNAELVIDLILERMVKDSRPVHSAYLARAAYRMGQVRSAADGALGPQAAATRAAEVFRNQDANGDSLLDRSECNGLLLYPSVVDTDNDGRITLNELTSRYEKGARTARLEHASRDIEVARSQTEKDSVVLKMSVELALLQADSARQKGQSDAFNKFLKQAEQFARKGLELDPPDLRFYVMLSRIELQREPDDDKTIARAESHIRKGLERLKQAQGASDLDDPIDLADVARRLRWTLADLLISRAQPKNGRIDDQIVEEAQKVIKDLRDTAMNTALFGFLEGRILLAQRQWHIASLKFEEIRPKLILWPDLVRRTDLFLGRCYKQLNNPDAQLDVFRRALKQSPLWTAGRLQLSLSLLELNRVDEALDELRSISSVPGVPATIARLLIIRQLQLPEDQRSAGWLNVERALVAEQTLREKVSLPPLAEISVLRAEALSAQKNFRQARSILEKARQEFPDNVLVWSTLVNVVLRMGDGDNAAMIRDAEKILNEASERLGDRIELRLSAANIAVKLPPQAARTALEQLEGDIESFNDSERLRLFEALARTYAQIGDEDKRRELWMKIGEFQPYNLQPHLVLAQLARQENDDSGLADELEQIRRIEGKDGPNGNFVKAVLLIRKATVEFQKTSVRKSLEKALQQPRNLLVQVTRQRPYWAAVPHVQGDLEILLKNRELAVEHYRKAIALGNRSRTVIGRVVEYLFEQKQFEEADQVLRQLSQEDTSLVSGNLARLAWRVAWQRQQYEQALGLAGSVATRSREVIDLIWLARLHFARGERGSGVEQPLRDAVAMAVEKQPETAPMAYIALITYLVRVDRIDGPGGALELIEDAKQKLPKEPPHIAPLTLARCYEMIHSPKRTDRGFLKLAEKQYLAALAANEKEIDARIIVADFYTRHSESEKADIHLAHILDPKNQAPEFAVAWANRRKAQIIARGGVFADTVRALEILDSQSDASGRLSLADLKAKAVILARRPYRKDRLALIQVFKDIESHRKLTAPENFDVARLLEAAGDWPAAQQIYHKLLNDDPENTVFLGDYIFALLNRHGSDEDAKTEAESLLERLVELEPDSFRATTARAKLLHLQGKSNEAVPVLNAFLERIRTSESGQVFRDLLKQEKPQQAIAALEKYLSQQSDAASKRLSANVRQLMSERRTEEAITILEDYIKASDLLVEVRAELVRVVSELFEEIGEIDAAEKTIREYASRSKQPDAVLSVVAFLGRRKRTAEALELCESAWKSASHISVAQISVGILRSGQPTAAQIEQVESRLSAALAAGKPKEAAPIRIFQADLKDLQGRYDEAAALYQTVLAQNDRDLVALNNLAWLLSFQRGRSAESLSMINRAIDLVGPIAGLLDTRGVVHLRSNKTSSAISDLRAAIEERPSPPLYFHLAQAQLKAGKRSAARKAFQKALKTGLTKDDVHPLEREGFESLARAFGEK